MALYPVGPCGLVGINRDLSPHELKPAAWTNGLNVRFLDGMAFQARGHGEVYQGAGVVPYHLMPVSVAGVRYWLYAGLAKIYAVTGNGGTVTHTNLTRQTGMADVDYTGAANAWTSADLSGLPILNPGNTTDPPQAWDLNIANRMAALANWDAGWFCKAMRAHRYHLIALNMTKGGVNYPRMVKWSHPAEPGAVPSSWNGADETLEAGEIDVADCQGVLVDGGTLGDTFIIYANGSAHRMDYTGGPGIWSFTKILGQAGAMNRNCYVEVDVGGAPAHLVLTGDDVILHSGGREATSVLDKVARRDLFAQMDTQLADRCFVFKNPFFNEVFVCFPTGNSSACDKALVWNYKDGTIWFRDLPALHHATFGAVERDLAQPWDGDGASWDSQIATWNAIEASPDTARVLMGSNEQKLFLLESSTSFDGTMPTAYLERRGLNLDMPDRLKTVKRIRPRVMGYAGETVKFKVGAADNPYDEPTYGDEMTFTLGSGQVSCDCFVTGRYHAIWVEGGTANQWRLDSFEIEHEPRGQF